MLATVTKLCLLRVLPAIVVSLNYIYVMVTVGIFTYHNRFSSFYPRDAMLARVLATALCLSVSVTSWCSVETVERIELVFGMGASFDLSYTVL